ncbi:FAD-binding oxidoreductase [Spirochaeta dissipatitropha]
MKQTQQLHRVAGIRQLTDSSYVLRMEWKGGQVNPGQRFAIGIPGIGEKRWYSVYSRPNCEEVEFLIREVQDGLLSRAFRKARIGDLLEIQGPAGHFTIDPGTIDETTYLFIATGTGIAPFHAFVQAYPDLNYILLHGVRYLDERYEFQDYHPERYVACVSRQKGGDYYGRVTDYIHELDVPPTHKVYLCGNQQMIYQVYYELLSREHPREGFHTEVYF